MYGDSETKEHIDNCMLNFFYITRNTSQPGFIAVLAAGVGVEASVRVPCCCCLGKIAMPLQPETVGVNVTGGPRIHDKIHC